jgi:hypothetical protein
MPAGSTQLERIVSRFVKQPNGCWHHTSKPNVKGYSITKFGWPVSKTTPIHRLSWMHYNGNIPEGMVIDHLCHDPNTCEGGTNCEHRRCVNPEHLQLVTAPVNNAKTVRVLKFRTHCKNGHELKDNTYKYLTRQGVRSACHTCKKEQTRTNQRKYRAQKTGV